MRTTTWLAGVVLAGCGAATGNPGAVCGNGVYDCTGACVSAIYVGDGACNREAPDLSCKELDFDGGDCGACGDGKRNEGEACDDGNDRPGDGCDASCRVEPGFDTAPDVDTGAPECGDGLRQRGEQCDDGNTVNGDGCTKACTSEILEAQILLLQAYTGIDSAGKAVGVKLSGDAEPSRLDIVAIRSDAQGNTLQCSLGYRPREEDVVAVPAGGFEGTPPSPLAQWLVDQGLVWGFQIVPGTDTYEPRPHQGCLDDARYAGDPHASYLGTQPVYVGLKATPTDAAKEGYATRYTNPVDPLYLVGATFLVPTTMARGNARLDVDGVATSANVSVDGSVQLQNGRVVYRAASTVVVDAAPTQGWYTFLQSVIYEISF